VDSEVLSRIQRKQRIKVATPWILFVISAVVAINYATTRYTETIIGTKEFSVTSTMSNYKGTVNGAPVGRPDISVSLKGEKGESLMVTIPKEKPCSIDMNDFHGGIVRITEKRIELNRILSHESVDMKADEQHISSLFCSSSQVVSAS
jgi:hypothetical protein